MSKDTKRRPKFVYVFFLDAGFPLGRGHLHNRTAKCHMLRDPVLADS